MAKKAPKGGKGNVAASTAAGQVQTPAEQSYGGVPLDDGFFSTFVPSAFQGIERTEAGIDAVLTAGGIAGDKIAAIKADPDGAVMLNEILLDPDFQARVAKRLNTAPAETQVSGEAASKDRRPADNAAAKPKKPAQYPRPVGPNVDTTGKFVRDAVGFPMTGELDARRLTDHRIEQRPDGTVIHRMKFSDGTSLVTNNSQEAAAVAQATQPEATGGKKSKKQAKQEQPAAEKSWIADPSKRPTYRQRLDQRAKEIKDAGQRVPPTLPLTTGMTHAAVEATAAGYENLPTILGLGATGVAGAMGVGAVRSMMGSGTAAPPPQQPINEAEALQRFYGLPSATPSSPPAPAQPQPNPAGSPPDNNTTLMQRLMRSREYA